MALATAGTPSGVISQAERFRYSSCGHPAASADATAPAASGPRLVISKFTCRMFGCLYSIPASAIPPSSLMLLSLRSIFFSEVPTARPFASIAAPSAVNLEPYIMKSSMLGALASSAATCAVPSSPVIFLPRWNFFRDCGDARSSRMARAACSEMPLFMKLRLSIAVCCCNIAVHARTPFSPNALSLTSTEVMFAPSVASVIICIAFRPSASGRPAMMSLRSTSLSVFAMLAKALVTILAASIPKLLVQSFTEE
mmetsp:Transcript_10675/g.39510  ORF Transcript_10675/g.39510 Transcript_10675/m.39510 type:complete len:254 (-) Transcript_10675:492-1253(-)